MPNIKFTNLDQLQNGVRVIAQFSRRDNEDGSAPDYGPPKAVVLYVTRRQNTVRRGTVTYPKGSIANLMVRDFTWAEYSEGDYSPLYHEFLAEEWRMKILEVIQ